MTTIGVPFDWCPQKKLVDSRNQLICQLIRPSACPVVRSRALRDHFSTSNAYRIFVIFFKSNAHMQTCKLLFCSLRTKQYFGLWEQNNIRPSSSWKFLNLVRRTIILIARTINLANSDRIPQGLRSYHGEHIIIGNFGKTLWKMYTSLSSCGHFLLLCSN